MKTSLSRFKTLMVLTSLTAALALTGCAGVKNSMRLSGKDSMWNPVAKLKAEKEKEAEPAEPVTMVVTWKGSVYETAGAKARGFGGRIFFYDADNNAVEADGELTVYGFDDTNKKSDDVSADKKFVFRDSEFQTHKTVNGLGASYSVWIPWEKAGGYRKTISLIPIFKTSEGKVLKGGQSVNVLHGKTPERQLSNKGPFKVLGSSPAVLSQANYEAESNSKSEGVVAASYQNGVEDEGRIKTSTISVTRNLARRIEAVRQSAPVKSASDAAVSDLAMDRMRRLISEQKSTAPVSANSASQESKSETVPSNRRAFGSPGSFK